MRILHIGDLHFGKSIYNMSLLEDQRIWAEGFVKKAAELKADAIVIAGDVYDRSQPSDDAVSLLDGFIADLEKLGIPVMIAAGNHDSAHKLSVHSGLLSRYGIHFAGVPQAEIKKVELKDEYGPVDFYIMPYIFPLAVRQKLGQEDIHDHTTAAARLLDAQNIDHSRRTVLVAHQCVTNDGVEEAERTGSETSVGGISGIDYRVFDGFDYVALGHIHGDSHVGREAVRYCGTPMCYHFNETKQKEKGALLVTMAADGSVTTEKVAIDVKHHMVELQGDFEEVCDALREAPANTWFRVVLKDRINGIDEVNTMRGIVELREGRKLLEHDSLLRGEAYFRSGAKVKDAHSKSMTELFSEFYSYCSPEDAAPSERDAALFEKLESTLVHRYGEAKDPSEEAVNDIVRFMIEQEGNAQ